MSKKHSSSPEPDEIPASVNPYLQARSRAKFTTEEYLTEILAQNRMMLSRAITLVESNRMVDQQQARSIIEGCLPHSGRSFRLGVTGVPGVGKSTFIESLGMRLIENGHHVAVLTVDPSSQLSKGSILGDKTRMPQLSTHSKAFIRPSPAGQSLGGVAAKTRELILLCEAAGFDFIIVETVGVGQSEVAVHALTDFFLLLFLPGGGDEIQGIKRGVVEMADMIAVNKADGDQQMTAQKAMAAYQRALHLFPAKDSDWIANAMTCSALENTGITKIIDNIDQFKTLTTKNGYFDHHRQEQAIHWFKQSLNESLLARFYDDEAFISKMEALELEVTEGRLSPQAAVEQLMKAKFR